MGMLVGQGKEVEKKERERDPKFKLQSESARQPSEQTARLGSGADELGGTFPSRSSSVRSVWKILFLRSFVPLRAHIAARSGKQERQERRHRCVKMKSSLASPFLLH